MGHFPSYHVLADDNKKLIIVYVKNVSASEGSLEFFQKMVLIIGFGVLLRRISRVKISNKLLSQ